MNSKKMGIKGKLLLLIGGALTAFIALAGYSGKAATDLRAQIELLGNSRIPISKAIGDIRASSNGAPRFMWVSLANLPGSPERANSLERVTQFWAELTESLENITNYQMSDIAKQKISEIRELMPKLGEVINKGKIALAAGTAEQDAIAKELLMKQMPPLGIKLTEKIKELNSLIDERNKTIVSDAQSEVSHTILMLIGFSLAAGLSLMIFGYIFASRLAKNLMGITESVGKSSEQVASASTELSGAAQQLSAGATEGAASLEETVASIEELTAMVKLNADNAKEAAALSQTSRRSAEEGEVEIRKLVVSVSDVAKSSKEIEDIINVIDDIAFQTNLLALNAAVEAARAGEQGKGFAVVAEAVRNLAQRSASAAKDITKLIKDSVAKTEGGVKIADQSGVLLKEIVNSVKKVADLNAEISNASQQQADGINQISKAMNQLDQVTQSNAASAEEAAASSEQMSTQAVALQTQVRDLTSIIDGNDGTSTGELRAPRKAKIQHHVKSQTHHHTAHTGNVTSISKKRSNSENVIPFESENSDGGKVGTTDGF